MRCLCTRLANGSLGAATRSDGTSPPRAGRHVQSAQQRLAIAATGLPGRRRTNVVRVLRIGPHFATTGRQLSHGTPVVTRRADDRSGGCVHDATTSARELRRRPARLVNQSTTALGFVRAVDATKRPASGGVGRYRCAASPERPRAGAGFPRRRPLPRCAMTVLAVAGVVEPTDAR